VAFASGPRVSIPLAEASAAIPEKVPRVADNFTVYRHWPFDFLAVYSNRRVRDKVVAAGVVDGRDFALRFSPWCRQLQAVRQDTRFRTHLELTGVPAHACNRTTVAAVVGSAVCVGKLGAVTASMEDLGRLHVVAWTDHVELLPKAKALLIEEPTSWRRTMGSFFPAMCWFPSRRRFFPA
jgi:hypothetical protein